MGEGGARRAGRLRQPERGPPNRLPPFALDVVRQVFAAYEGVNAERGQLDFEDLLLLTAGAIETDARRSPSEVHERYRHFTVDEYQDVNPLQQRLLDAWLGDRDDLCVVGDPNQTIYSFTGASPRYLREFAQALRGRDASCGWCATTARPTRSSRWPTGSIAGSRLQAQGGDGPEPTFDSVRRRAGRGGRGRRADRGAARDGVPAARDGGPVPGQRAVGGLRSRADRRPASRTSCAAGSGSSSGPRSARRWSCCAGRPARPPTTTRPA